MGDNKFEYKYTAPTQEERLEIEDIRRKYVPKDEKNTQLIILRKMDRKVQNLPTLIGLCIGVVFCLVFGLGLTMVLEWNLLVGGIFVMLIGLVPMALNPIIVSRATTYLKDKYKEDILKISEELLNNKG